MEESSCNPSPVKSSRFNNRGVNFKNVPDVDHETERMLNGTPVHQHQLRHLQRALDEQHARHLEAEEEILAIETTAGRYPMITQVQDAVANCNTISSNVSSLGMDLTGRIIL